MQRQEDNLSTILLNRHYKAMPEAKKGKLNIKIMKKINKITILSDDLLSETLGGLSNRTEIESPFLDNCSCTRQDSSTENTFLDNCNCK